VLFGGAWVWAGAEKTPPENMAWGFTYSAHAARDLGLDPVVAYRAALDELKPDRLRLVAYWTDIEPRRDEFVYRDLDLQVAEAEKRGIPYVLAIGRKVPRYPECYTPAWAQQLSMSEQHERILGMMQRTVQRYDHGAHLITWQVENEPYLKFGECPKFDESFLKQEVSLVRGLTTKPIMLTDSGELTTWLGPSQFGDQFGTTLYRSVLNGTTGGVYHHMWWPGWYTRRANLLKKLRPNVKQVVVAELQAEPWGLGPNKPQSFYDLTMSHEQFASNLAFAREVGMPEVYLWGVEWWYYEKLHGDSYYWQTFRANTP
jgi:hypothetical protein